jgi:hypothetical protein
MSNADDPAVRKALEDHAEQITRIFKQAHEKSFLTFKVNGPRQFPVKDRWGKFTTHSFVGDEELSPRHCYVGKRGRLIYALAPAKPQPWVHAEVDHDNLEGIAGLKAFINEALDGDEDQIIENAMAERRLAEKQAKEREARELATNPDFGSW